MRRQARSLGDYFSADAGLARFSSRAFRLLALQRRFLAASPLAASARVVNLKFGRIVIHADNGAVATKLRQLAPSLTDLFRTEAAEVTGIEIHVQPPAGNPAPRTANPQKTLGSKQKQALTSLASGLPDGSPLKDALRRFTAQIKVR